MLDLTCSSLRYCLSAFTRSPGVVVPTMGILGRVQGPDSQIDSSARHTRGTTIERYFYQVSIP